MDWLEPAERGLVPDDLVTLLEAMGMQRVGCLREDAVPGEVARLVDVFGAATESTWAELNLSGNDELAELITVLDDERIVVTSFAAERADPPGQVIITTVTPVGLDGLWALHRTHVERCAAGPRDAPCTRAEVVAVRDFRARRRARLDDAMQTWSLRCGAATLVLVIALFALAMRALDPLATRLGLSGPAFVALAIAAGVVLLAGGLIALGAQGTRRLRAWVMARLPDPPRRRDQIFARGANSSVM